MKTVDSTVQDNEKDYFTQSIFDQHSSNEHGVARFKGPWLLDECTNIIYAN